MGLFSTIMKKLGFGGPTAQAATPSPAGAPKAPAATSTPPPTSPSATATMPMIDVVSKLEGLAAKNAQKLNWKTSIVVLLKLLGLDSSLNARKEPATELGCPADKMGDSAQMNIWLHKTVLRKLFENGGNIPKELLS